jgi:cell division protein FtsI/penicillin-binding protein 2
VFAKNRSFYVQPGRQGKRIRYNSEFSGIAWGQGQLEATPLALARMAGTIANGGELQPSRFLLEQAGKPIQRPKSIQLAQQQGISRLLKGFMLDHSSGLVSGLSVAGKTGTPQRILNHRFVNDGWYVFFADSPKLNAPMVVCIRIEEGDSSAKAVALANQIIIPELLSLGYF